MKKLTQIQFIKSSFFLILLITSCAKESDNTTQINDGLFTDSRDNKKYKTVTINNKIWMAENLAYLPKVYPDREGSDFQNRNPYYYVYDYNGTNVEVAKSSVNYKTYGVLYNWEAANISCPNGWHLPSESEWDDLSNFVGDIAEVGGILKSVGTNHWKSPNAGATNQYGFNALPGGISDLDFDGLGEVGIWWSSTEENRDRAIYYGITYDTTALFKAERRKDRGVSVRCVKD